MRERGITRLSTDGDAPAPSRTERRDAQGHSYVELPRLRPFDLWFLHDPDDYYR